MRRRRGWRAGAANTMRPMADTNASTSDRVFEAARNLGRLVAAHPHAAKYHAVLAAIRADADAQRLLGDYTRHIEALREKEETGQPIEVADKRKLEDLQSKVAMHPRLRELQMAQMDYVDLMRKVDAAIAEASQVEMAGAASAG